MVILFAIEELSHIDPTTHAVDVRARQLLLMIHYTYWATVMPPLAHATMLETMRAIIKVLRIAVVGKASVDLPWLFIAKESVNPILKELQWWLGPAQKEVQFQYMLQKR